MGESKLKKEMEQDKQKLGCRGQELRNPAASANWQNEELAFPTELPEECSLPRLRPGLSLAKPTEQTAKLHCLRSLQV